MGSPSAIISLGLGSWGSSSLVVTLGYGSAELTDPQGKLCFERIIVSPALILQASARPSLLLDLATQPALTATVKVNECLE